MILFPLICSVKLHAYWHSLLKVIFLWYFPDTAYTNKVGVQNQLNEWSSYWIIEHNCSERAYIHNSRTIPYLPCVITVELWSVMDICYTLNYVCRPCSHIVCIFTGRDISKNTDLKIWDKGVALRIRYEDKKALVRFCLLHQHFRQFVTLCCGGMYCCFKMVHTCSFVNCIQNHTSRCSNIASQWCILYKKNP